MRQTSDTNHVERERIRKLIASAWRRLESEDAFTLVELTIVLLIMGILLTIAVPSYLSFKDKANQTAARSDVALAVKSIISYGADNFPNAQNDPDTTAVNGTTDSGYTNVSLTYLATKYDASISTIPGAPYVINPAGFTGSSTDFCLTAAIGRWIAVQHGPGSGIQVGTLFTPGTCTVS